MSSPESARLRTAVGVDVGGTKILAGLVQVDGSVGEVAKMQTPRDDPMALLEVIEEMVGALGERMPIGVAMAGLVTKQGEVVHSPNIGVSRFGIADELSRRFRVPVAVRNDTAAAMHAEWRVGGAQGVRDALMLTLGTGVGGAVLNDGRHVEGRGFGGELGHIVVESGGRLCGCGNRGCLEAYASGTAIAKRATQLIAEGAGTSLPTGPIHELDVMAAAADGDDLGVRVVEEAAGWLAEALVGLVNAFDPELVVLGGGVVEVAGSAIIPVVRSAVEERVIGAPWRTPPAIKEAMLADLAGVIGAGLHILDETRD